MNEYLVGFQVTFSEFFKQTLCWYYFCYVILSNGSLDSSVPQYDPWQLDSLQNILVGILFADLKSQIIYG